MNVTLSCLIQIKKKIKNVKILRNVFSSIFPQNIFMRKGGYLTFINIFENVFSSIFL